VRRGKILLRRLAERRLGPSASRGRKRGFAVLLEDLFVGPRRRDVEEWMMDSDSDLVEGRAAAKLFVTGQVAAADVWTLAALAAWENRVREKRLMASGVTAVR
jgi:hypothetical protein